MALSKAAVTAGHLASLELCPLAKRIAAPKKSGSRMQQHFAHLQHSAYVNIVNLLHHYPGERTATEKFVIDSILEREGGAHVRGAL